MRVRRNEVEGAIILLLGDRPGKIGSLSLWHKVLDGMPPHSLSSLPPAHTEAEGRSGIKHRHPEEEALNIFNRL
jgi:hypothetical protein